jgi:hypothetical protein
MRAAVRRLATGAILPADNDSARLLDVHRRGIPGAARMRRYADMPDDRQTWRLVARGLDERARALGATSYAAAGGDTRHAIAEDLSRGALTGGAWAQLNVGRAWSVVMRGALAAFYSHPWAWNEIGFGGPAYPRGYMRKAIGDAGREPSERPPALALDPVRDVRRRSPG